MAVMMYLPAGSKSFPLTLPHLFWSNKGHQGLDRCRDYPRSRVDQSTWPRYKEPRGQALGPSQVVEIDCNLWFVWGSNFDL